MHDFDEDTWLPQWPQGYKPNYRYTKPTFETHVGKSGKTWLIPAVTRYPNRGDHIYVTAYSDVTKRGDGFARRTIHLPLIGGGEFELNGGWHSNADACLADTGIDCTNQYLTYGAVGLHRAGHMVIYGLIYQDKSPQIGSYKRIETLAKKIATERGEHVVYGVVSLGGAASGVAKGVNE